jgi:hypothetical protein
MIEVGIEVAAEEAVRSVYSLSPPLPPHTPCYLTNLYLSFKIQPKMGLGVIPAAQKAEVGGSLYKASSRQKCETLAEK